MTARFPPDADHDPRPEDSAVHHLGFVHHIILRTLTATEGPRAHQASVHYLVGTDGGVWPLLPETSRARLGGPAFWRGNTALGDTSLVIALLHPGDASPYPVLQLASLCDLCLAAQSRHKIPPRNVVGLGDVAPERATDPGAAFDWAALAQNGVGVFPDAMADGGGSEAPCEADTLRPVRAALATIGYCVAPDGPLDAALSCVLRAFQRHWRAEAVTGEADLGTRARLAAVARLCEGD